MANILLGVTGSVAAIKTPILYQLLQTAGHEVRIVATHAALYFLDAKAFPTSPQILFTDTEEWPGTAYQRGDAVLHIELRRWADLFLLAPLDANTLAKLVNGICDNCLTCVWRAWDLVRPVVVAPAMNTLMWQHPMTRRQLRLLGIDFGAAHLPSHLEDTLLIQAINERSSKLRIVPPQIKELACGDIGIGAMADVHRILQDVQEIILSCQNEVLRKSDG